jgi:hypothetical protein
MSERLRNAVRAAVLAGAAMGLAAATGCNILAPIYMLAHGPEKVPEAYTLDKKRSTVVFIDDRGNAVPRRSLRTTMGQKAEQMLLSEGAVTDVVSSESAMAVAAKDRYGQGQPLSITAIGKSVGAEVVVYVTIDRFTLSPDGSSYLPTVEGRAKVMDVTKETRLWPNDERGQPFTVALRQKQGFAPQDLATVTKSENELATEAGIGIAQLFYAHEVQTTAGREKETIGQ